MQYSITREPVQEPQTPMFNLQAHSRPSKWKKMLDFCCICDLKCSKTSKPVQHARLASLFVDVLCIPSSIIKASKWCTGNLKKMEAAWTIQSASSYQGHSTNSIFVDRWLHCVCAFIKLIADQSTTCTTFLLIKWIWFLHIAQFSVFRRNIYHTLIGNSHALTVFDALPRLVKQIPFLSTTNMWWKIIHISKPQTQSGIIIVILIERVQKQN